MFIAIISKLAQKCSPITISINHGVGDWIDVGWRSEDMSL
jgi:hypothetical protein